MRRYGEGSSGGGDQAGAEGGERRYKGVRRRRWGKWVSEVRVPGTRERLWLGSFSTPEAAAVAFDTAVFYLKGPASTGGLNFPGRMLPGAWAGLSPRSIQKAASDTGMAVDAELAQRVPSQGARAGDEAAAGREDMNAAYNMYVGNEYREEEDGALDISVDDMEIYL
ncbi:hypothetical protein Taro_034303 [Colocasia esculenta]|uniref:AP2/ERF domain-containing protein n=1 Tax=Colocasia esculenta TaxID=4460 RepID=A0A843W9M0_COLES|nr:hypothetical protein [Colocasia esculenta]